MVRWWLGALITLCLCIPVRAATLTASKAIEIAQKNCAEQVADNRALNWTAHKIDGQWVVGALPEGSGELKGWLYVIPQKGPLPKACERYTVYRAVGVRPF